MRLVLFTEHYPFSGEPFLENEIKYAWRFFSSIIIVTLEKKNTTLDFVPPNARVVRVRQHMTPMGRCYYFVKSLFSKTLWKEFFLSKKKLSFSSFTILKKILIQENAISYLKKAENQWLDSKGEDSVLYYSYWLDEGATYLSRLKKERNALYISRAHGGDCFFDRGYHPYRQKQLAHLDYIFPISGVGKKDIIEHNVCDEKKIIVSRLGIDCFDKVLKYERKESYLIVSCSNVIPLKRLDLMVKALSLIEGCNIKWVHFGFGSLMSEIEKLAESMFAGKPNITFEFKGATPHSTVLAYYEEQNVDLFLNLSDYEGISVAAMEAMMFGIPVVARNVGGMSELIDDNCGRLLPKMVSANQITDAIVAILQLPLESYIQMRQNARMLVKNRFSAMQNYQDFYSILFRELKNA